MDCDGRCDNDFCPWCGPGVKGPKPVSIICERDIRSVDVWFALTPTIEGPFVVENEQGKLLGSAVVQVVNGGFALRFILDNHSPESFDLENEPARCRVQLQVKMENNVMSGKVVLQSK